MFKRPLPMVGHTRGNRLAITCELKCGSACSHPVPNTSDNRRFRDIVDAAISRRTALGLGGGLTAAVVVGAAGTAPALADHGTAPKGGGKLDFEAIAPVPRTVDDMTVPEGYDWATIIRWGDPLFEDSPEFDLENQTRDSQSAQFGYNCDYLNVISDGQSDRAGYLVCNHEYTNENIMFPPQQLTSNREDVVDARSPPTACRSWTSSATSRASPGRMCAAGAATAASPASPPSRWTAPPRAPIC